VMQLMLSTVLAAVIQTVAARHPAEMAENH
jgi:hypothetical protein